MYCLPVRCRDGVHTVSTDPANRSRAALFFILHFAFLIIVVCRRVAEKQPREGEL